MDDFAGIFTILIFLFYAVIAGAFIVAAIRQWLRPFAKKRMTPSPAPSTDRQRSQVRRADGEQTASHP